MSDICWFCSQYHYHDYKDKHGLRCPSCGQKEKDDPKKVKPTPIVKTEAPVKRVPATKRTQRSR